MPKAKPYSGPIDANLAAQLLNSSGATVDDVPLGDALRAGAANLEKLVALARGALDSSEFAQIVADHLAIKMNRRGASTLSVSDTGQVILQISYEDAPTRQTRPQRKRRVPLIKELRAQAEALGVDISRFGIKRKEIWAYLQEVEAKQGGKPKSESRKKRRSEPRSEPPKVQATETVDEEDPGPMSAGPDETKVTPPPDEVKPSKKGFVKTAEAVEGPVVLDPEEAEETVKNGPKGGKKGGRRSMRQLVQDSKDVDITDLLASEPPE